jgi:hypothetical protein
VPVIEPWRLEREGRAKFWLFLLSIPIMLVTCGNFLVDQIGDAIKTSRLPDVENGTYSLPAYPHDPDDAAIDPFLITFTEVVVTDDKVQFKAVAKNITKKKQQLDCTDNDDNVMRQWVRPTVKFRVGNNLPVLGSSWCEDAKHANSTITVDRRGSAKVVAEFDREKRFTTVFVIRWGGCVSMMPEVACERYTAAREIDLHSATKS